jgi:cytoskeletal protein CcmA (bactofilin family)
MDTTAGIGPSIHIKGDVTASEPLTIAGRVDGTIAVDGHALTVAAGGHVQASVTAHTIVIGGIVNGRLSAGARIVVRETATIEGDLSAPAVSFADGATVHGKVETAARRAPAVPVVRLDAVRSAA